MSFPRRRESTADSEVIIGTIRKMSFPRRRESTAAIEAASFHQEGLSSKGDRVDPCLRRGDKNLMT